MSRRNELRTPIAIARGLGSGKSGTGHWWWQRVTSVALLLLSLSSLLSRHISSEEQRNAALSDPVLPGDGAIAMPLEGTLERAPSKTPLAKPRQRSKAKLKESKDKDVRDLKDRERELRAMVPFLHSPAFLSLIVLCDNLITLGRSL